MGRPLPTNRLAHPRAGIPVAGIGFPHPTRHPRVVPVIPAPHSVIPAWSPSSPHPTRHSRTPPVIPARHSVIPAQAGIQTPVSRRRVAVCRGRRGFGFPPKRAVGATFAVRVPLPDRFNAKYDPADRPSSTPVLLKPGERRRLPKPAKPKPTPGAKPSTPRKVSPSRVKETPEERGEHEGPRQLQPKRKEASKKAERDRRKRAKELGLCRPAEAGPVSRPRRVQPHGPDDSGGPRRVRQFQGAGPGQGC